MRVQGVNPKDFDGYLDSPGKRAMLVRAVEKANMDFAIAAVRLSCLVVNHSWPANHVV